MVIFSRPAATEQVAIATTHHCHAFRVADTPSPVDDLKHRLDLVAVGLSASVDSNLKTNKLPILDDQTLNRINEKMNGSPESVVSNNLSATATGLATETVPLHSAIISCHNGARSQQ